MEIIVVAIIGTVQVWMLELMRRNRKDVSAVKDQVVNHHPESPNMRDESDKRHAAMRSWFAALFRQNAKTEQRLEAIESTQTTLLEYALENRSRIEDIESTQESVKTNDNLR